jgi:hypothetical protein
MSVGSWRRKIGGNEVAGFLTPVVCQTTDREHVDLPALLPLH